MKLKDLRQPAYKERGRRDKLIAQFVEYMIGGGVYFWTGYGTFALCFSIFKWNWLLAKAAGDIVGLSFNFYMQRYWAFDSPQLAHKTGRVSLRYLVIVAMNLAIDYAIVVGLHHYFGLTVYIGAFVSAGFFTAWNFLWYKLWVFNPAKTKKAGAPAKKMSVWRYARLTKLIRNAIS